MDVANELSTMPFTELLGIEVTEAENGRAVGRLDLRDELHTLEGVAHGAVPYALADTVGAAAILSKEVTVAPTIDMRIDYLAPATTDLTATAEVVRMGGSVGVADVEVRAENGDSVAATRGVYKTGGDGRGSAWDAGRG